MNNDNYPPGAANDPRAPYNQQEPVPVSVDIMISQTLSRRYDDCLTSDYIPRSPEVEYYDDGTVMSIQSDDDFTDTDFTLLAEENDADTPLKLIQALRKILLARKYNEKFPFTEARAEKLLENCDLWSDDETEIFKD